MNKYLVKAEVRVTMVVEAKTEEEAVKLGDIIADTIVEHAKEDAEKNVDIERRRYGTTADKMPN